MYIEKNHKVIVECKKGCLDTEKVVAGDEDSEKAEVGDEE